jgi:hypothetical protein
MDPKSVMLIITMRQPFLAVDFFLTFFKSPARSKSFQKAINKRKRNVNSIFLASQMDYLKNVLFNSFIIKERKILLHSSARAERSPSVLCAPHDRTYINNFFIFLFKTLFGGHRVFVGRPISLRKRGAQSQTLLISILGENFFIKLIQQARIVNLSISVEEVRVSILCFHCRVSMSSL